MFDTDVTEIKKSIFYQIGKRLMDILFSVLLLIVFFPVIVMIVIAIKLDSSGPILADTPRRVGKNSWNRTSGHFSFGRYECKSFTLVIKKSSFCLGNKDNNYDSINNLSAN